MLVDTSVWIDHFRRANADLDVLLNDARVITHPFVIGELACGALSGRRDMLRLLEALPSAPVAAHAEVMTFVEQSRLHGAGLGWIDVHLLASARLAGAAFWSLDRRLRSAAERLGLGGPD